MQGNKKEAVTIMKEQSSTHIKEFVAGDRRLAIIGTIRIRNMDIEPICGKCTVDIPKITFPFVLLGASMSQRLNFTTSFQSMLLFVYFMSQRHSTNHILLPTYQVSPDRRIHTDRMQQTDAFL